MGAEHGISLAARQTGLTGHYFPHGFAMWHPNAQGVDVSGDICRHAGELNTASPPKPARNAVELPPEFVNVCPFAGQSRAHFK